MRLGLSSEHLFVGRHREREQLLSVLSATEVGQSSVLVLSGPAGIGKTSLVREVLGSARVPPASQLATRCSPFDPTPHAPLERLATQMGQHRPASVEDDLDVIVTSLERLRSEERRDVGHLVDRLCTALSGPATVVIDDLHWAGPAVLDFVELLAGRIATRRRMAVALLLLTRPLPPDHDIHQRIDRLSGDLGVHQLELGAVDESADADLIRALTPEASTALVTYIRRAAGGNPLLTRATLGLLRHRSLPADVSPTDERAWETLTHHRAAEDPLANWLDGLDRAATEACSVLAHAGGEATIAIIAAGLDRDPSAVSAAVEAAEDEQVVVRGGDTVWFRHDLYRQHFADGSRPSERRLAHARLARHLLGADPEAMPPSRRIRLCRHIMEGDPEIRPEPAAVAALQRGGRDALRARAWGEATRFLEASLAAAPPEPDSTGAESLLWAGLAHYFNADTEAATDRLGRSLQISASLGDDRGRAAALVPMLRIRTARDPAGLRVPADVPELARFLDEATDPLARSQVLQMRAESLITAGRAAEGETVAAEALSMARKCRSDQAIAFASLARGYGSLVRCSPLEAEPHLATALAAAERSDEWYARNTINARSGFASLVTGRIRAAQTTSERVEAAATDDHDFINSGLAHALQGMVAYLLGDFATARRRLEAAASDGRRGSYAPMSLFVEPCRAMVNLTVDDGEGLEGSLSMLPRQLAEPLRALSQAGSTDLRPRRGPETDLSLGALVATVMARGRADELTETEAANAIERLEEVVEQGTELPSTMPIMVRRALARALVGVGRIDEAADQLEEISRLCRSQDCRSELTWALLEGATTNVIRGRREEAVGQALEANVLARRLDMPLAAAAAKRLHRERLPTRESGRRLLIMVSDVVGSTVIGQQLGDRAYFELVMEHHALVRQLLDTYGGTEFSEGGDSLLAWFDSAPDAIACALAIQTGTSRRRRTGSLLEAKVGLAQGRPFFSHGRPYGSVVNRASRLAAFADPNLIAVDEATVAEIDLSTIDLRTTAAELRGIGRETVGIIRATQSIR